MAAAGAFNMWTALEQNVGGVPSRMSSMAASVASAGDPAALLNTQLASALSLTGDAQYWEESISPSTIRQSLAEADPSNSSSTPALLRGMKWLLASISKGRNVSDFYPHVVKLVGAVSLEVRKMVYMYLVQYANHDSTTRELSLLSINSFQRGLADSEALIRALALRVLTSIRIPDILQIQILGVQKCSHDLSPYVRKCAANALAKLHPHCDEQQQELLLEICRDLLWHDQSTMVLTSALIAVQELCPQRLDLLHGCYRKVCHLLTDMDEWGQVVVIDMLARYCRQYFAEPAGWRDGTAEAIDRERRVRRTIYGIEHETAANASGGAPNSTHAPLATLADKAAATGVTLPPHNHHHHVSPKKIKRRVVIKGFYSDEDDESGEEEVYADSATGQALPISSVMRQGNVLGGSNGGLPFTPISAGWDGKEDADLADDHRLLLNSAMHLLKSRNAGVVLSVCSLQYYCGISSVKVRAAMGKALVRIHRDRREIQYVVLSSIRTLASECPSAFVPFLHDFFVKALDPPFTRFIKLDILTSLALEPAAIEAVLQELRSYVRHGDTKFACAAISAVGRVTELARIVYDRHGRKSDAIQKERAEANQIALNALHGLLTLTQVSQQDKNNGNLLVVGQAVQVMHHILQLLQSDDPLSSDDWRSIHDPNSVRVRCLHRILLLLMQTLSERCQKAAAESKAASINLGNDDDEDDDENENPEATRLGGVASALPEDATAAALWVVGEGLTGPSASFAARAFDANKSRIRYELARMLTKSFPDLTDKEKEQAVHVACKLIVSSKAGVVTSMPNEQALCEQLLAMGRLDVNPDVRDRARFESGLMRAMSLLQTDFDSLDDYPAMSLHKTLSVTEAREVWLRIKPAPSSIPVENHSNTHALESEGFRFGTLSSLVGHRARSAYIPLPPWASSDSPGELRNPVIQKKRGETNNTSSAHAPSKTGANVNKGFYDSDEEEDSDDDSDEDSDEDDSDEEDSDDDSEDADDEEDDDEEENNEIGHTAEGTLISGISPSGAMTGAAVFNTAPPPQQKTADFSDDDSDEDDSDDDDEGEADDEGPDFRQSMASMVSEDFIMSSQIPQPVSSISNDFQGLTLAPVVTESKGDLSNPDFDRDSSDWIQLVRPEHAGGLSVNCRFLRGATKAKEAQLVGLQPKATLVCIQLRFECQATSTNVIRRIRLLQRPSSSSSSSIAPRKVYLPPEVDQLKPGQRTESVLSLDFSSASDRDGTLLAKMDIKFGSGGIPVEIKPTLGDTLLPRTISTQEFDAESRRLQGFQRVETVMQVDGKSIPKITAKATALCPVGPTSWADGKVRYAGTLPASNDPIFVLYSKEGAGCKLTVCSENALAANSLMNALRRKIQP